MNSEHSQCADMSCTHSDHEDYYPEFSFCGICTNENAQDDSVLEQHDDRFYGHHTHKSDHLCCPTYHNHTEQCEMTCHAGCGHHHGQPNERYWLKAVLGITYGIGLLMLSLIGVALPWVWLVVLTSLSTLLTVYLGFGIYKTAFEGLMQGELNHSSLYTISTITLMIVSIVGLFIPGLTILGEAAPLVLGFWHLGESIEHTLIDKLNEKLDIRDCLPKKVKKDNGVVVPVQDLLPGDIIEMNPKEVIPVDGQLMSSAYLKTSRIDGSSNLKWFSDGDGIKSGMEIPESAQPILIKVKNTYENSHLSVESEQIKASHKDKAPIEAFTSKVLKYFVPILLGIAVLSGLFIGFFFSPMLAIQSAITVMVSACPCVLSLITPMTVKIAMKKSNDLGIRFKDGKAIQAAAEVDDVVFDLNGTLTQGESVVTQLELSDSRYASHLALLESCAQHNYGQTINDYLEHVYQKLKQDELTLEQPDLSHRSGVKAKINGEIFIAGNLDMMHDHDVSDFTPQFSKPEHGQIYFAKGHKVIGQIRIEDKLRPDAILTVQALQKQGKHVHICTGDHIDNAKLYATRLGIPNENIYASSAVGERSKVAYIKSLKENGRKVAMIGDSANDAAAIATADLGIAVYSPTADSVTQNEAGVILQTDYLSPIFETFILASKAKDVILTNLAISLTYNVSVTLVAAGLFLAVGLILNPFVGVALMILESAIVFGLLFAYKQTQPQPQQFDETLGDGKLNDEINGCSNSAQNTILLNELSIFAPSSPPGSSTQDTYGDPSLVGLT